MTAFIFLRKLLLLYFTFSHCQLTESESTVPDFRSFHSFYLFRMSIVAVTGLEFQRYCVCCGYF